MMRTTVSIQPQIIIVACCITLRRSAYGAWGNYSVHDDKGAKITKASFIGHINPLRYRGYYYDRETRLYYLQSRYYDFANCRFINADTFATTDANGFLSANMFAYCENNPVMRADEDGESWQKVAVSAFLGGITGAITDGLNGALNAKAAGLGKNEIAKAALRSAGVGFVSGAIKGAFKSSVAIRMAVAVIENVSVQKASNPTGKIDPMKAIAAAGGSLISDSSTRLVKSAFRGVRGRETTIAKWWVKGVSYVASYTYKSIFLGFRSSHRR